MVQLIQSWHQHEVVGIGRGLPVRQLRQWRVYLGRQGGPLHQIANWLHCFSSSRMSLDLLILPADLMGWSEDYLESSDAKLTKHSSFDLQSLKHMYDLGYTFRIIFTVPYKTATKSLHFRCILLCH